MVSRWFFGLPRSAIPTAPTSAAPPMASIVPDVAPDDVPDLKSASPPRPNLASLAQATLAQATLATVASQLNQSRRPIRLMTLGSCRVHGPVFATGVHGEAAYPDLALATTHYFHTVRTHLQFLAILSGTSTVDVAAYPWIFLEGRYQLPRLPHPGGLKGFLDGVDAILVEVCADDEITADGVYLHGQEIVRSFVDLGGPAARAWWTSLTRGDDPEPLFGAAVAEVVVSDRAPPAASLAMLRRARLTRTSRADIARALIDFVAFAGRPVGVVTHVDAVGSDGRLIARRRQVIETVVAAAADASVPVFQPGRFIESFGQAAVFEKDGADTAHYRPAFLPDAGQALVSFAASFAATRSGRLPSEAESAGAIATRRVGPAILPVALAPSSPVASALAFADLGRLEAEMVTILGERIARLGADGSGLGAYYANRIGLGQAFGSDDRLVLQALAGGYRDYDVIIEAAAGTGQLGLALAVLGRRVVAIEVSKARYDCMVELKSGLAARYPSVAANATLIHGAWPQVLDGEDVSRALFVAVDFVFTAPPDAHARAIAALNQYGGAILDVAHFVQARPQPQDRRDFLTALESAGFAQPVDLGGSGGNSAFIFTRPLPV